MEARLVIIPADALVLLVGPAGSGKSTFAARRFRPTQVLSSDEFRARVSDDAGDQGATRDAFRALHAVARARLRRGLLTVIDATNVLFTARAPLLAMAAKHGRAAVAVCFDLPLEQCLAWNAVRPGRSVPERAVRRHHRLLQRTIPVLAHEGFAAVVVLGSVADVAGTTIRVAGTSG